LLESLALMLAEDGALAGARRAARRAIALFEEMEIPAPRTLVQLSAARLRKIAEASGQDLATWDTCIADPAVRAEIEADAEEATSLGITGTPTLVIGDWMESGIPAPKDLYARIDEALGH
ncbi:MAG: DsbA family protein, partial [Candidatus Limnocylindrus sp.]